MLHPNALKAQEIAEALGAVMIPVHRSKKPKYRYWRGLEYAKCLTKDLLELYDDETNIAVVQGEPSSGLISIDFDEAKALKVFLVLNPALKDTLTTSAARGANLWFKMQGNYPPLTRLKRGSSIWAEWRSTGAFTVIHGIHEQGMPYTSNEQKPINICLGDIVLPEDVNFKTSKGRTSSEQLNAAPATTPLHTAPCTSAHLHNIETPRDSDSNALIIEDKAPSGLLSPTLILSQLKTREAALDALKKDNPTLHKLYLKLVDGNFTAMPHQRNAFLTEAVPFLYRAVAPALILPLVEFFYIVHRPIFKDPLSQHTKEAKALLKGVSETYWEALPPEEQKLLQALTEREQIAYRILRDLAMRVTDDSPPGLFFMSDDELGLRLAIKSMEAHRILKGKLTKLGIIVVVLNGTLRSKGHRGIATTYRWNVAAL
ncbi:bifunctional DNA primase/polymerase [bacterium]|nr:bifunctional DNA primase/polymerase [bacterium]